MKVNAKEMLRLSSFSSQTEWKLDPENRWVQSAHIIPWELLEARFEDGLPANRRTSLRRALATCLIQEAYGYSDQETVRQIWESPYLQYFCGFPSFDAQRRQPSANDLSACRGWLEVDTLHEINRLIAHAAVQSKP